MIAKQVSPPKAPTYFLQEAWQILQHLDHELQTLGQNFTIQKVHTLMRLAHTLKGAAATVGLDAIKTTTQTLENTFKALCVPETGLTAVIEGLILDGYDCLKLLISAQSGKSGIDEHDVLDRMATIATKLRNHLGDRFGQDSYLPTSAQLGVDVTASIFESGVTEYLDELENALASPNPEPLRELLHVQADVFIGLAESLGLPGFGTIAQATLAALKRHPDQVIQIAQIALEDYRAGQTKVLLGDRTEGGGPSAALQQLGENLRPQPVRPLNNLWQWLNQPVAPPLGEGAFTSVSQAPDEPQSKPKIQSLSTVFDQCHQELNRIISQDKKSVLVEIRNSEIPVAQPVARRLQKPLFQLMHHAFVQNIETPHIRRRRGKSAVGKIQLAAKQAKDFVVICVWDNGCGANPLEIHQRVKSPIESLQGTITVVHRPGQGTCFMLRIPTKFLAPGL
ncbi:Hpt domain-containing protein [Leptothoe sp. PORK10 BA2]|uniref:Hpt domain-containing protein n=1 Tax=Leptothoe sp. PORK10 BA2 TaxID=3110254 RepID=UPI002B1EDCDF|nr:Hpt domain-containing protein [Leptothoe sp. PORK10 BA2]MEA5464442.1 Hpt domain-containing protein [Leptothoe sp. PORK10 BA2]